MMKPISHHLIDRALIDQILQQACLNPDEAERNALQQELRSILGFLSRMSAVDTEGVEPLYHPFDLTQPLRKDQITPSLSRNLLLSLGGRHKDGYFLVPRMIKP
ncbi:MAG: Asp-tRNA(Asn)/Glu-tRNA(Gln) amidotransferase subunit GatC [Clostridia bacterium]|nr:Asp-tRNA(Asn)/Glu-tRNA(Gln) amidotransferase subunit GatC [Clostridia bacterium]